MEQERKTETDEISNLITTETEIGEQIGELSEETKLKTPQQDWTMRKGNATAAWWNEEENDGQNEEEEEEVDNEEHRWEDELAKKREEIKLISPKQRPHLHRINNKQLKIQARTINEAVIKMFPKSHNLRS